MNVALSQIAGATALGRLRPRPTAAIRGFGLLEFLAMPGEVHQACKLVGSTAESATFKEATVRCGVYGLPH